ncbi:MAG TPA: response regulator [Methylomirabilota bacterium]|nr:response regulator [Methylomirabilota bacterium]
MSRAVLVVDDEADLVSTYERLLRRQGYRVLSTGTRAGGLAVVARELLGLVIADVRLPDGDGLDVVRAARAQAPPVPAIVATVLASRASREAALAAGATGFLAKPFATGAFMDLVSHVLGRP